MPNRTRTQDDAPHPPPSATGEERRRKRQRRNSQQQPVSETIKNDDDDDDDVMDVEPPPPHTETSTLSPVDPVAIGTRGLIKRCEYLRLLQQSLAHLGFEDVAHQLEQRSGVPLQSPTVSAFQEAVLLGDWIAAVHCVDALLLGGNSRESSSESSSIPMHLSLTAKFLILEQKFDEILSSGDTLAAMKCLRMELTPLQINTDRLHALSRKLVVKAASASASASATSTIDNGGSKNIIPDNTTTTTKTAAECIIARRRSVLHAIQEIVPPGTCMLSEHRLEELVEQALLSQIDKCRLHNTLTPHLSLLKDYDVGDEQLPLWPAQTLKGHTSEVWHLQFSHDGKMLATCGRDCTVVLWDVLDSNSSNDGSEDEVRLRHVFIGHTAPVLFLAWSDDDTMLASCGEFCHVL